MRGGKLTATISVIVDENTVKPLEELTQEELDLMHANMKERLSSSMSRYYSNHIDEYQKI